MVAESRSPPDNREAKERPKDPGAVRPIQGTFPPRLSPERYHHLKSALLPAVLKTAKPPMISDVQLASRLPNTPPLSTAVQGTEPSRPGQRVNLWI